MPHQALRTAYSVLRRDVQCNRVYSTIQTACFLASGDGEDLVSLEKSRLAEMLAEANSLQEQGMVQSRAVPMLSQNCAGYMCAVQVRACQWHFG